MLTFSLVRKRATLLSAALLSLFLAIPALAGEYEITMEEGGHGSYTATPNGGTSTTESPTSYLYRDYFSGKIEYSWTENYHYSWNPSSGENDEPVPATVSASASGNINFQLMGSGYESGSASGVFKVKWEGHELEGTHTASSTLLNVYGQTENHNLGSLNCGIEIPISGWDGDFSVTHIATIETTAAFRMVVSFTQNIPLPALNNA